MKTISIKNWETYQHYKDRNPPWIKLHRDILTDYEFSVLPDASKAHLVGLWILASQLGNKIPYDPYWIAQKINATEEIDLKPFIDLGFITVSKEEYTQVETQKSNPDRYVSQAVREKIFKKFGQKCAYCKSEKNLEIDHIIPVSMGGTNEEENLQLLCRKCNRAKRNKLSEHVATTLRSKLLQQMESLRSPETETETETETTDESAQKIHKVYLETISPPRNSTTRSKKNLKRILKKHEEPDLIAAIANYAKQMPENRQYRKDPANFFGINEPYFEDYLPANFTGVTVEVEEYPYANEL